VKCTHSVVNKALQLRPDYDDAMAYMNLMYRERSDIQCDDSAASSADLNDAGAEHSTKPTATNPQRTVAIATTLLLN
jgi:hypothetical protein